MKKRTMLGKSVLALSAAALVAAAGLGSAYAYFTTYVGATGGYTLNLGDRTVIEEEVSNWIKHFRITSREDSEPIYVRARAYSGEIYNLEYSNPESAPEGAPGGTWIPGADGFYYYSNEDGSLRIVEGGESTSELLIEITNPPQDHTVSFNVVVVYESTPVQYTEDGAPYADWTKKLDVVNEEWNRTESEADGNPNQPDSPENGADPGQSDSPENGGDPSQPDNPEQPDASGQPTEPGGDN